MRTIGGIAALATALLVAGQAMAEDEANPADAPNSASATVQSGIGDQLFGSHPIRDFALNVLRRFVDDELAEFDRVAARYTKLVEFTRHLEERDEADFEARAERFERLSLITRRLEAEQAEREARDFETQVDLFVRERAFTRELERSRAASMAPVSEPADPARQRLYER